jgi:hypothetical protein
MWWFLAGLVGMLGHARRRRSLLWLLLGIVLTPLPASIVLLAVSRGRVPIRRDRSRFSEVILLGAIVSFSLLVYVRCAYVLWARPSDEVSDW